MIVGSGTAKHLLINWTERKNILKIVADFNTANNVAGWQWVAGCGAMQPLF